MKTPAFRRSHLPQSPRHTERGVTMVLVVMCMVTIIAMAALSIDVVTLYLAREEAQRSADAAALAAARIISISGITGTADPDTDTIDWQKVCGGMTSAASLTAQAIAQANAVGGSTPKVSVRYSSRGNPSGNQDCSILPSTFAINPTVIVQVTRANLPTLFSRIWSRNTNTVSATATAEAFNPSNSASITGDLIPVKPRCVKPWIIPNLDPMTALKLVDPSTGAIVTKGIRLNGGGSGIIGENFVLSNNCRNGDCNPPTDMFTNPPQAGFYVPALVTPPASAVPSCASGDYQSAVAGCDENTVYACGTTNGSQANLNINPGTDTSTAVQCTIHQNVGAGQDVLDPSIYPYQITAGLKNPIAKNPQAITSSNSIMTLPIYDQNATVFPTSTQVTVVGFLQVFVQADNGGGNLNVYVLNVVGCGNDPSTSSSAPGFSPVPIRLITPQ